MRPETAPAAREETPAALREADRPTRLADYRKPDFLVEDVRLVFDLAPSATRVRARISFRRNGEGTLSLPAAWAGVNNSSGAGSPEELEA